MAPLARRLATVLTVLAAAAWLAGSPPAAADPFSHVSGGQSASDTIDDLQAQGFNVSINWLSGYDTKPLAECRVTNVDNPGDAAPSADTFTTVYVDVVCPNGDDGGGSFTGGVGIG